MTDKEDTKEPTAIEKALARTETITAQIIMRATEAEERIDTLRKIQKCVDEEYLIHPVKFEGLDVPLNNSQHDWNVVQVRWEKPPFEIKEVHVRCENCMCALFLGRGDNRLYVELQGLDAPLEEYLIHPTERGGEE